MTINSVSLLGQSQGNINRLKSLNALASDLQRQIATGKKTDTFAGLGSNASTVQRLRADASRLGVYLQNIDTLSARINVMSSAMSTVAEQARSLIENISLQVREGEIDDGAIRLQAQGLLMFAQDLVNSEYDNRYLFAGSDTSNQPYVGAAQLQATMAAQMNNWMAGTLTTSQIIANTEGMNAQNLGFSPTISSGGVVRIQIDDGIEVDYTVRGDIEGFQDVIRALSMAANLRLPEQGDAPSLSEFHDVLSYIHDVCARGIKKIDSANGALSSKMVLIKSVQETHIQDKGQLEVMTAGIENADPTEAILTLQALNTQLTASYQVTNIVSQLSLVNFLTY